MSLLGDLGTAVKNKLGGTSVDNTVPRYNGTTCTIQGSGVTISDTNVVTTSGGFVGNLTGNATTATNATNATKLNNAVEATTATANTIVKRDGSGYVYVAALNSTLEDTTTAATHYYCETGSDGWLRPKTLANVQAEIGASLALSGTPTAPTAAVGTNTTQIATTAFVLANSTQNAQFASSLAANGYQKLPSGLIIQWGSFSYESAYGNVVAKTFPIAFTTACYSVTTQGTARSGAESNSGWVTAKSTTSFSFADWLNNSIQWIAIGY